MFESKVDVWNSIVFKLIFWYKKFIILKVFKSEL